MSRRLFDLAEKKVLFIAKRELNKRINSLIIIRKYCEKINKLIVLVKIFRILYFSPGLPLYFS